MNHWLTLQQQYQKLSVRVNQVVLRERLLLLIVLLVIIYALWSLLAATFSQKKAITTAKAEEVSLTKQIAQLQQKILDIEKNAKTQASSQGVIVGPKFPNSGLVSNATVIPMLKSLVNQQPNFILKELHNLPDQPLRLATNSPANDLLARLPGPLYEQGEQIVFESNYWTTYKYLQALENLPWMLFWNEFNYTVGKYPLAEVKLVLHTVSRTKEE